MGRIPQCNLHPDRFMFATAVLVHNSTGETETFEAYRCQKLGCIRHYAVRRGYFDITEPDSNFVEDSTARTHLCPTDKEVLVVTWLSRGYVYRCPVEDCDYAEPYATGERNPVGSYGNETDERKEGTAMPLTKVVDVIEEAPPEKREVPEVEIRGDEAVVRFDPPEKAEERRVKLPKAA